MRRSWVILAAFFVAATVAACSSTGVPSSIERGLRAVTGSGSNWTLYQTSDMSGDQMVYIAPDACKMTNKMLGVTYMVKKDPDWRIIVFNDKDKLIYEGSQTDFLAQKKAQLSGAEGMGKAMGEKASDYKRGKSDTIAGLTATQYISQSDSAKLNAISGDADSPTSVEMWFTEDIATPETFSRIVRKQNNPGLPADGVLLRMVVTSGDGIRVVMLDTVKCDCSSIPASTFVIPAGYEKVKSEWEVAMGKQAGGAMNDVFRKFTDPAVQKNLSGLMDEAGSATRRMKQIETKWTQGK
ncbi:MAG: hypothetical protein HY711_01440 [Candidatus Melainabacteria bacterium]|nr:hypothetical protein [Candidatus Melainabacteria bacterium]